MLRRHAIGDPGVAVSQNSERVRSAAFPYSDGRDALADLSRLSDTPALPPRVNVFDFSVAIDLSSSHTAVAFHKHGTSTEHIQTIDDFPGTVQLGFANSQIASELWYPNHNKALTEHANHDDIRLRFGNEVPRMSAKLDGIELSKYYDRNSRVSMMKLLLDNSTYAQLAKTKLINVLDHLKALDYIKKDTDVFSHFLGKVLHIVKDRLTRDNGLTDHHTVEVVFAIPVCWTPSAVRVMSAAVEAAMKQVCLGTDGTQPCHIFIVHEAEAQAMHALRQTRNNLRVGEVFIQADVGGLTTDFGCYTIAMGEPTRLGSEVLQAFGAGKVNDALIEFLISLLRGENYLFNSDFDKLRTIIEAELLPEFENTFKRSFEGPEFAASFIFRLRGLRAKPGNRHIHEDAVQLNSQDMWSVFQPTVEKIGAMLERAVTEARINVRDINKFVLSGGFGDSPCLRRYLKARIAALNRKFNMSLQVCFAPKNMSATGVATGGILRTIDKTHGPARKPCQSIGIKRTIPVRDGEEEYPDDILAQESKYYAPAKADYIYDTIRWIAKVNAGLLPSTYQVRFKADEYFEPDEERWVIKEHFFASEVCTEDHWKLDDPRNDDAVEIGFVQFDITDMREEIRRFLRRRKNWSCNVQIEIEMTVIDRYLESVAYWNDQMIDGSRQGLSIASAFTPGTQ